MTQDTLKYKTHAYMTEAPPPATMVQMRPAVFKMVSFNDAPLLASRSAMYASYQVHSHTHTHTHTEYRLKQSTNR